ncbi:MAG: MarR family winged helix-turn-helix transcriptional regulator [Pikeienuella sp.]
MSADQPKPSNQLPGGMPLGELAGAFALFTEVGIISQLNRAAVETALPPGLLMPHFSVLNHLVRLGDGQTPLAIARAMQTPKTSMTHTLVGLEAKGLVEMRRNPDDGRSKQVWITEAGKALRLTTVGKLAPGMAGFLNAFPASDLTRLAGELSEIRKWLDNARG